MNKFLTILCFCSLLLSLIACFSVYYSCNINMYAIVISILSLLVTALIGWQIFNSVDINKKVADINRIAKTVARKENEIYTHTTLAVVYYINAVDCYKRQNMVEKTVDGLFNCIEEALKGRFRFPIDLAIDYLLYIPSDNFSVYKDKKDSYIRILCSINHEKAKMLIDKILK